MADRGTITPEEAIRIQQKIQSDFAEKMETGGISDERLIAKLNEKLDAVEEKAFRNKDGIIYTKKMEAHDIQLKAVDISLRLKGRYSSEKHHHTIEGGLPIVPLTEDEQADLEARKQIIKERKMKEAMKK